MDYVAALAEALEVTQPVIPGVMIEMCSGQDDAGSPHQRRFLEIRPACRPTASIAPSMTGGIEPTSIGQAENCSSMWSAAFLTNPGGALEAHAPTDLRPVARIEPSHLERKVDMAGPGQPKAGGRKKGTPNKLTREVLELVDEAVRENKTPMQYLTDVMLNRPRIPNGVYGQCRH